MERRFFLKYLPFFGFFFLKIQDVLARITSSLFTHLQSSGEDDRLTIQISGVKSKNIPARYHRGSWQEH